MYIYFERGGARAANTFSFGFFLRSRVAMRQGENDRAFDRKIPACGPAPLLSLSACIMRGAEVSPFVRFRSFARQQIVILNSRALTVDGGCGIGLCF